MRKRIDRRGNRGRGGNTPPVFTTWANWKICGDEAKSHQRKKGQRYFDGHLCRSVVVARHRAHPQIMAFVDAEQAAINCVDAKGGNSGHAADLSRNCTGTSTPALRASLLSLSIRHSGMLPALFQLETVVGAKARAFATLLVPPSASMNCDASFMKPLVRIS